MSLAASPGTSIKQEEEKFRSKNCFLIFAALAVRVAVAGRAEENEAQLFFFFQTKERKKSSRYQSAAINPRDPKLSV